MSDRKVRVGLDPVSGQEVDKSNAFIALKEGAIDDEVIYFESEANYKQYIEK
ncbi:hypothetical protein [Rufibacter sp. LB8]|nr:hypothetical protein [Rufibacter sp. LB8]